MPLTPKAFLAGLAAAPLLVAPVAPAPAPPAVSAPLGNIRYDVTFNRETAAHRSIKVEMSFSVAGPGDVLLSLPAWTPGAYEVDNFARWVSGFSSRAGDKDLHWEKLDYDTWRIRPAGAKQLTVSFDYLADSLDNAIAWSKPDFCFFNGTNLFLYPEGRSLLFPATVAVHTEAEWQVVTGMHPAPGQDTFGEKNYHDLVDMPFFVGQFDYDSAEVGTTWERLATYPAGIFQGPVRAALHGDLTRIIPAESRVFGETPWNPYTTFIVFDSSFGGGSALEHQNSHLAIYTPRGIGQAWIPSITAHEMFHSWNVKRMRPAEMWPYRYDVPEPTPWLWVSEGITDYYADLALVRGGIIDSSAFFETTMGKIVEVDSVPPVSLEDASLSTWIHPTDGTGYIYYPKGSLAGLLLDILIRDASDNHHSLDDVMRNVYQAAYKHGRGFTAQDWWGAVSRAAGGRSFRDFADNYIDGREPFPYARTLPLAGLRLATDTIRDPRLGIQLGMDSAGPRVAAVLPGGAAEAAGVQPGDIILALGDIPLDGAESLDRFRSTYGNHEGAPLPIRVRRNGQELTLQGKVVLVTRTETMLVADPAAAAKASRIRHGLLTGSTD
jgi:predicted metalloprotease with PDZ domain